MARWAAPMAHTNIVVSYAPARAFAPERPIRQRVSLQPRWGRTLAGTLLAGGAVFALGQFVTADGTMRDAGFPMRAVVPTAQTKRVAIDPRVRVQPEPAAQVNTLPYLSLIRNIVPEPATPRPAPTLSAAAERPVPAAGPVATPEQAHDSTPVLKVDLAPQPSPPAPSGLRRDLQGFLEAQGHELVVPDPPGPLVASPSGLPRAPMLAARLAEVESPLPSEPGLVEAAGTLPAAARPLAEVGKSTQPMAKSTQHLAEIEPMPAATPAGISDRSAHRKIAPGVAIIPTPRPADRAPSAQVQSYPLAVVNGEPLGAVTMRDGGASEPAIHLGALLELVRLRMPEAEFVRLSGAAAADRFVGLDELRAAGIAVEVDARHNRLVIGAR